MLSITSTKPLMAGRSTLVMIYVGCGHGEKRQQAHGQSFCPFTQLVFSLWYLIFQSECGLHTALIGNLRQCFFSFFFFALLLVLEAVIDQMLLSTAFGQTLCETIT